MFLSRCHFEYLVHNNLLFSKIKEREIAPYLDFISSLVSNEYLSSIIGVVIFA